MALLATQRPSPAGTAVAYSAAGAHEFVPSQHVALYVKNASAGAVTVTVPTPAKVEDVDVAEIVVSVPAGAERLIPAPPRLVAKVNGRADVNFSATASVTVAVIET
jgi:hypothetical protein